MVYVAIFGGSVIAYTLGGVISSVLSKDQVGAWGWCIPFLLGAVAALIAMLMRRHMQESEAFTAANSDGSAVASAQEKPFHTSPHSSGKLEGEFMQLTPHRKHSVGLSILLVIGMVSGITSSHYTWSSYVSTYAITHEGMTAQATYWVTVFAQIVALISLPFWGSISDKIGRKPVIYTFAIALAVLQLPLMNMINSNPITLLIASTAALFVVSAGGALLSSVMSEVFPTTQRTKGIGLAYSLSVAIFGGTAPYIFQMFVSRDMAWGASAYVIGLCLLTLISMKLLPETKGINLHHV